MALIFGIAMAPIAITQADAIAPDRTLADTPDTFFIRGDLTAPAGDATNTATITKEIDLSEKKGKYAQIDDRLDHKIDKLEEKFSESRVMPTLMKQDLHF